MVEPFTANTAKLSQIRLRRISLLAFSAEPVSRLVAFMRLSRTSSLRPSPAAILVCFWRIELKFIF